MKLKYQCRRSKARASRSPKHLTLGASAESLESALTRCLPKRTHEMPMTSSLQASNRDQEDERIANYAPTDAEDEEITLLQPIMNLVTEDVREAIMADDVEIFKLVREL